MLVGFGLFNFKDALTCSRELKSSLFVVSPESFSSGTGGLRAPYLATCRRTQSWILTWSRMRKAAKKIDVRTKPGKSFGTFLHFGLDRAMP